MHACIHKTDKRLNMTASLKKWNKEEDGKRVHFYLQVNHVRLWGEGVHAQKETSKE